MWGLGLFSSNFRERAASQKSLFVVVVCSHHIHTPSKFKLICLYVSDAHRDVIKPASFISILGTLFEKTFFPCTYILSSSFAQI